MYQTKQTVKNLNIFSRLNQNKKEVSLSSQSALTSFHQMNQALEKQTDFIKSIHLNINNVSDEIEKILICKYEKSKATPKKNHRTLKNVHSKTEFYPLYWNAPFKIT